MTEPMTDDARHTAQIEALQAEVARLRGALCEIAAMPPSGAFLSGQVAAEALATTHPEGRE